MLRLFISRIGILIFRIASCGDKFSFAPQICGDNMSFRVVFKACFRLYMDTKTTKFILNLAVITTEFILNLAV